MKVLGLLSGTSHDGIDAAVVDFAVDGDVLRATLRYADSTPYPDELRDRLVRALPPARLDLAEVCALDTLIGQAFAAVAGSVAERVGGVDLVCSHGQTVYHWVVDGHALGSLQIGQPAWIAERLGVPVVADVRARDIAAGGQGAPLVSATDLLLLADLPGRPAALNLGGIANITVPAQFWTTGTTGPTAYDIGPANALIDAAAIRASGGRHRYDVDGRLGAAGAVHPDLLHRLLAEPYYALPAPKSTGKELFHAAYLNRILDDFPGLPDVDAVATVTALTAEIVAAAVHAERVDTVVASGGGCANPTLMRLLRRRLDAGPHPGVTLVTSDELGVPSGAKEAIAFALIGWHTAHGLTGTVAGCTGATGPRLLGTIVPGAGPLRLPSPLATPPRSLRMTAHPSSHQVACVECDKCNNNQRST